MALNHSSDAEDNQEIYYGVLQCDVSSGMWFTGTEKVYSNKYPVTGLLQGGNTSSEALSAMTVGTLTLWILRSNGTSPDAEVSTRLGVKLRLPVWPWVCH